MVLGRNTTLKVKIIVHGLIGDGNSIDFTFVERPAMLVLHLDINEGLMIALLAI